MDARPFTGRKGWQPAPLKAALGGFSDLVRKIANLQRSAMPARRRTEKKALEGRRTLAELLGGLPSATHGEALGPVLVDASWDNPNYWYRYALLRAGLGIEKGTEVGLLGPYMRRIAQVSCSGLGITRLEDFQSLIRASPDQRALAVKLLRSLGEAPDMLDWQLPSGLPASLVYDGILKRQRSARIDLGHPLLLSHVVEALQSIAAAETLLDRVQPRLVVLSHAIEFRYGSIAWCAIQRNIPVIVAFGNYGSVRYCRLSKPDDFFETVDRPYRPQIDQTDQPMRALLAERGRRYLQQRMSGKTDDIGARYAFGSQNAPSLDRRNICRQFGWDEAKPIVAVYASNWFDYPHSVGMSNFADFLDWLAVTLEAAKTQTEVNWLFRAHPCDQWYGGVTLADLMAVSSTAHIRLCPVEWNGAQVQASVDGLVTVHGTAGVEYAVAGKPVLLGDRGWYHDIGFAHHSVSRESYVAALMNMEWLKAPLGAKPEIAAVFAGIYFPTPMGQHPQLGDDSEQIELHPKLMDMLSNEGPAVLTEISDVTQWWKSSSPHFHTWRALRVPG